MKHTLILLFLLVSLILGSVVAAAPTNDAQFAIPILVANTSFLNIRSGDGPQYTIIVTVVGGTELPVLATNKSGLWDLVATAVGPGWVDISFTLPRGDFRNVPVVNPTPGTAAQLPTPITIGLPNFNGSAPVAVLQPPHIVVNTSRQNIRTGPGAQFQVITVVSGGTTLDAIGVTPDTSWYLVTGDFGQGWISSQFVIFRGLFSNVPIIHNAY